MKFKNLGQSGIKISRLIMGCWQAGITGFKGRQQWPGANDADSTAALLAALEGGITTFDTALIYGEGHSERLLGKTLAEQRSKLVWATKTHPIQHSYGQVINSCHISLRNLNTDYIDLYQLHFPPGALGSKELPISEPLSAMAELKKQGKIRAIGLSNCSLQEIKDAQEVVAIDSLQPPYSLFWRGAEKKLFPHCKTHNIDVLAYSPLAQGILTGKFMQGQKLHEDDNRRHNILYSEEFAEDVSEALKKVESLGQQKNAPMLGLALNWILSRRFCSAIVGGKTAEQVKGAVAAMFCKLDEDDIDFLDNAAKKINNRLDNNPIMWRH